MFSDKKAILTVFVCLVPSLFAQGTRGTISGRITDPSGSAVPGANIQAVNLAEKTEFKAASATDGYYVLPYLPLGAYRITVEAAGFKTFVREGLEVHVNDALSLNVPLEVGAVQESVTVSGEAPLLVTDTASLGQVVTNRVIVELPLNGRNPFVLQQLVSGVIPTGISGNVNLNRPWDTNGVSDVSVNGTPGRANMMTLNGVYSKGGNQVSYTPSIDAVQEFKVQKNSYDAEFGHVAGGTINVATKSGSNAVHGSLYEFLRNSALDANNYFAQKAGAPVPLFRMNQFGATAGGPVVAPHYNGRDKTFWFFNWEGVRQGTPPATVLTSVPTDLQRNGDFSKTLAPNGQLITVFDPLTSRPDPNRAGQYIRTPFQGNAIPAARINPISKNVLKYIPAGNRPGDPVTGLANYMSRGGGKQRYDQYGARVDQNFSQKSRFFANVGISNYFENYLNVYENISTAGSRVQNTREVALDYVYMFTPQLLGNVRYGFARKFENTVVGSAGFNPADLGFPQGLVTQFPFENFPRFNIGDAGGSLGHGGPSYNASDGHNLTAMLTRSSGRHNWKAGTYLLLLREYDDRGGGNGSSGQYTFGRNWTQADPFTASAVSGFGTATYLLGIPSSGQVGTGGFQASQTMFYEFFFQDDIKVNSRLTVNLGLRWEYQGATTERFNRILRTFDFTVREPIEAAAQAAYARNPIPQVSPADFKVRGGSIFAGTPGVPRSQLDPELSNFAPRIGLACRVNNRMVWRAGFGVFYNPRLTGVTMTGFDVTTPMVVSIDGITPIRDLSNPFPDGLLKPPAASRAIDALIGQSAGFPNPQITTPKMFNWSTGFQYELPRHMLVEASYVGTMGSRFNPGWGWNAYDVKYLALGSELNRAVPNPFYGLIPATVGALGQKTVQLNQLLKPYPEFSSVNGSIVGAGHTYYHSAQLSLERRFSSGVTFLTSYTFSKLMDRTAFMNAAYSNQYENVISDIDRPQRLVFSGVWELPFGRGKRFASSAPGALGKLVSGWQVTNIATFQAGRPLQAPSGAIATGLPAHVSDPTINQWFNTKAFAVQPSFTLRTLSRNISDVRGSGINNWDLSFVKNTRIGERFNVQFRAEYFNAFNRIQWDMPDRGLTSGNFGKVTAQANIPRQLQFGLKVVY